METTTNATTNEITNAQMAKRVSLFIGKHSALVTTYLAAERNARAVRAKVNAYLAPVFASFKFEGIENPEKLYRCEDDEKCAAYYAACDVAHKANGFDMKPGYCPALVAEDVARKAKWALIETFAGVVLGATEKQVRFLSVAKLDEIAAAAVVAVKDFS